MKVLIVEDDEKSINSAKSAVTSTFGNEVEFTIARTARELGNQWLLTKVAQGTFGLIMTDGNVPYGPLSRRGPETTHFGDEQMFVGAVVAMTAVKHKIPCVLCTDSNGHNDLYGVLLDDAQFSYPLSNLSRYRGRKSTLHITTRPKRTVDGGKDWLNGEELRMLVDGPVLEE